MSTPPKSASPRWVFALALPAMLSACDTQPQQRSLKNEPSAFRLKADAPVSSFVASGPESTFGASDGPQSQLSTEELMSELKATRAPDQSIMIDLPADVLFDFDKAVLRPDAAPALAKAADLIERFPDAKLAVTGHTDAKGSDAYNDPLSLRRAQAVAAWLSERTERTPSATGRGKRVPIAPNTRLDGSDNPEGRQRNRRVEIVIRP